MKRFFKRYTIGLCLLTAITICLMGCEKSLDEVRPVSLGLPIKFGKFEPGDQLLAGQTLSIKGTGMKGLTEVSANGTPVQFTITDSGVDIKLESYYFPDGTYKFQMKRFDGDQLVVTPPVQVYSFHLSANAGKVGDEVLVLAAGGLNNVEKVLFTSASGTVEDSVSSHTEAEIKFTVPDKSVRGKLYLQLANPTDPANPVKLDAGLFSVLIPGPVITSVMPNSASYGSVITITGRNFGDVGTKGELFYNRKVLFTLSDGSQVEGNLVNQAGAQTATQIKVVAPYFVQGSLSVDIEYQTSNTASFSPNSNGGGKRLFYIANGSQLNALSLQPAAPLVAANLFNNVNVFATDKVHNRIYFSPDGASLNYVALNNGQITTLLNEPNGIAGLEIQQNRIFWRDYTNTFHSANLDGSNQHTLYSNTNNVNGFCGSTDGKYLFVLYETYDQNTGQYSNCVDRIAVATQQITQPVKSLSMAAPLAFFNNNLYYTLSENNPINGQTVVSIMSIAADGTSVAKKVHSLEPLHLLNSFGIDESTNTIYYVDAAGGRDNLLKSVSLNGSNVQELGTIKDQFTSRIVVW
jgi:hypothetical protein